MNLNLSLNTYVEDCYKKFSQYPAYLGYHYIFSQTQATN